MPRMKKTVSKLKKSCNDALRRIVYTGNVMHVPDNLKETTPMPDWFISAKQEKLKNA
jgi:hypothetical protein